LWAGLLVPGMAFLQSWHTGTLVNLRRTRAITESVAASLVVHGSILYLGVMWGEAPGLYVGIVGLVAGHAARTLWLFIRTRGAMRDLRDDPDAEQPNQLETAGA
jgi:hypothetical protein